MNNHFSFGNSGVYSHLSNAYGKNHFELDKPLQDILTYFNEINSRLSELGDFVGKELYEVSDYVDKIANPRLVTWGIDGERVDGAWLDPAERFVLKRLVKDFEIIKSPYNKGNWFDHFASIYLVADPGVACVITLTNQTAYALYKYGDDAQRRIVSHLIGESEDSSMKFGATWFTEIQGGSDLGANVVEARHDANNSSWHLNGDTKYFASDAGLADYALVTARPKNAPTGAKGIALFLVSKTDSLGNRNFRVTRLKEKSATRNVPTGEIEFKDTEAYLIGDPAKGIYYALENLTVSRLANALGALGLARKAYLESYYYAKKRSTFEKLLIEHPLIQRDLLDMEVSIEGGLALALKAIDEFQKCWKEILPRSKSYAYARLLTHISKTITAETSSEVTKMAMELHGGIGFLSEFPIERLHRESLVTTIWEGGSNIQALDMLEAIEKGAGRTLLEDIKFISDKMKDEDRELLKVCTNKIEQTLISLDQMKIKDNAAMQFYAKDILTELGHCISTILLLDIGRSLSKPRYNFAAEIYASRFVKHERYSNSAVSEAKRFIEIDRKDA